MEINSKAGSYLCVYTIPQQEAGHGREKKEHIVSELVSVKLTVWLFKYIIINWIGFHVKQIKQKTSVSPNS